MRTSESDHGHNQPNNPGILDLGRSFSVRTLRRQSSIEALRHELAFASLSLRVSRRSSNSSILSNFSTLCGSYSWSDSDTQIGEAVLQDPSLAFQPQALPYPKVKPALSRLSIGSASSESLSIVLGNDPRSGMKPLTSIELQKLSCDSNPNKSPPTSTRKSIECDSAIELGISPSKSYFSPLEAKCKVRITSSLATHVMWPECTEEDKVSTNVVEAVGKQPTVNRGVWEETGLSPRSKPLSITSEQPMEDKEELYAVQSSPQAKEKGHKRSDSSLSAIAAFPLPPDRTEAPQIRSTTVSAARKKEVSEIPHEEEDSAAVSVGEDVCSNSLLLASLLSADEKENVRVGKQVIVDSLKADINLSGNAVDLTVPERRPSSPELHELINNMRKSRRKKNNTNQQTEEETEESDLGTFW